MADLEARLTQGDVVILDGAMGTELQRRGVPMDRVAWSGAAVATHPEVVRQIHEDYIHAGADIVITNTFGTARHVLEPAGLGERVAEIDRQAVSLARDAREHAAGRRYVWIAGSLSSFLPENAHDDPPPPDVARANYREQADLLAEAGCDLLALEMMMDAEYTGYALEAAQATGLPILVGFSVRVADDGGLVFWRDEAPFAPAFAEVMARGGDIAAIMHSEIDTIEPALKVVRERWSGPIAVYPHSGRFVMPEWQFVDVISPEDYAAHARRWVACGAQVVGGCCGIGPEHIRLLSERLPRHVERPGAG